jgi:hypothetical protein
MIIVSEASTTVARISGGTINPVALNAAARTGEVSAAL